MQAARESAAPACEMLAWFSDEGSARPVRLTESREIAFIIALAMEAAEMERGLRRLAERSDLVLVDAGGRLGIASDSDSNVLLVSDADDFEIIGRCIWTARELD